MRINYHLSERSRRALLAMREAVAEAVAEHRRAGREVVQAVSDEEPTEVLKIESVRYIRGYTLWLRFNDGVAGEVDLLEMLEVPELEHLRDKNIFKQVSINPLLCTIAWPDGSDMAPLELYERVGGQYGSPAYFEAEMVSDSKTEYKSVNVE